MNSKETHAREALETFMKEQQITLLESVQSQMIHSNTTRKDLIEFTRHLGKIEFYEKALIPKMGRLHIEYLCSGKSKDWVCGPRAEELIETLSRYYKELEEARYQIDLLLGQIMMEIEHLTMD